MQAFCERGPVVFFLDDIQWADTASLDILHYAGQRWSEHGAPLLLLLAARSEVLATTSSLRTWLTGLHHDLPMTELALGPLTQDETLHLLAAMETNLTRNAGDLDRFTDLGQWLFRETRGQTFYLVESLHVLPAIPILEHTANWPDWTHALGLLGIARAGRGQYAAGIVLGQRVLEHVQRIGDMRSRRCIGCHFYRSRIYQFGGDYPQMLSESTQIVEGAESLGDEIYLYLGNGLRAWAESRLGKHEEATQSMKHAQAASQRLGGQLAFQDLFAAATAELFLAAGHVEEGLTRAEVAVELARVAGSNLSEGLAQRVWGQAMAYLSRWEDAETHLAASQRLLLSGEILLEVARTQVVWGLLCRDPYAST